MQVPAPRDMIQRPSDRFWCHPPSRPDGTPFQPCASPRFPIINSGSCLDQVMRYLKAHRNIMFVVQILVCGIYNKPLSNISVFNYNFIICSFGLLLYLLTLTYRFSISCSCCFLFLSFFRLYLYPTCSAKLRSGASSFVLVKRARDQCDFPPLRSVALISSAPFCVALVSALCFT